MDLCSLERVPPAAMPHRIKSKIMSGGYAALYIAVIATTVARKRGKSRTEQYCTVAAAGMFEEFVSDASVWH